MLIMSNTKCS